MGGSGRRRRETDDSRETAGVGQDGEDGGEGGGRSEEGRAVMIGESTIWCTRMVVFLLLEY